MPKIPGVNHRLAIRALERAGFRVVREGRKHVVLSDGQRFLSIYARRSRQRLHHGRHRDRRGPRRRRVQEAALSAPVAELVDATDSKSVVRKDVLVRVRPGARGAAMPGIASHAGRRPKALGNRLYGSLSTLLGVTAPGRSGGRRLRVRVQARRPRRAGPG